MSTEQQLMFSYLFILFHLSQEVCLLGVTVQKILRLVVIPRNVELKRIQTSMWNPFCCELFQAPFGWTDLCVAEMYGRLAIGAFLMNAIILNR